MSNAADLFSSMYVLTTRLNAASINFDYLFVFQSNLFICFWQLWQENRPDYFNMKLYVSQTDCLQVTALVDTNINVAL